MEGEDFGRLSETLDLSAREGIYDCHSMYLTYRLFITRVRLFGLGTMRNTHHTGKWSGIWNSLTCIPGNGRDSPPPALEQDCKILKQAVVDFLILRN